MIEIPTIEDTEGTKVQTVARITKGKKTEDGAPTQLPTWHLKLVDYLDEDTISILEKHYSSKVEDERYINLNTKDIPIFIPYEQLEYIINEKVLDNKINPDNNHICNGKFITKGDKEGEPCPIAILPYKERMKLSDKDKCKPYIHFYCGIQGLDNMLFDFTSSSIYFSKDFSAFLACINGHIRSGKKFKQINTTLAVRKKPNSSVATITPLGLKFIK